METSRKEGAPSVQNDEARLLNKNDAPQIETPLPGNIKPKKYGKAALLDYARQQAGTSRPDSSIEIKEEQLSFAQAIGRIKN